MMKTIEKIVVDMATRIRGYNEGAYSAEGTIKALTEYVNQLMPAWRAEKEISDGICDKCANGVDHAECVRLRAELEKVRAERDQWRQQALEEDGRANAIASGERLK